MKTTVVSLGGSIIVPGDIDTAFLKIFRNAVLSYTSEGNRIILVAGGGMTARRYQAAAKKIAEVSDTDSDWIGIKATKINAELLRAVFGKDAHHEVIDNPNEKITTAKKIIIGSGWKPGSSSDLDAVLLAVNFRADMLINMSNISYVYDKDPKKYKEARQLNALSWDSMKEIVGTKWEPGKNVPFDPVATEAAARYRLKVIVIDNDIGNFTDCLAGKPFRGTVIQ